ncbi:hypothetical protein KOW79_002701 [Hemibagrus wyckioides]|uniref:Uncharacterized protein n=1 Tax=Hemibagrus wyckioides TaxID=337641 RepID=A0A9D3SWI7_9TELE|nr:hypothetical protein KOW79_002701 [Hemibagrus wyckioides]
MSEASVVASPAQVQPKDNEAATHNLLIPAQLLSQTHSRASLEEPQTLVNEPASHVLLLTEADDMAYHALLTSEAEKSGLPCYVSA